MNRSTKQALQVISAVGLALSSLPAIFVLTGMLDRQVYVWLMAVGMLLWFGSATLWIKPADS